MAKMFRKTQYKFEMFFNIDSELSKFNLFNFWKTITN